MAKSSQATGKKSVSWPREAKSYANGVSNDFRSHLTCIAEAFAEHERAEYISKKHVDESFAALSRMGLRSKRWWQRADTWTAFGAFMFGISFSMPDAWNAVGGFLEFTEKTISVLSVISFVVMLVLGIGLYFWARHHGSLPKKPGAA